VETRRVLFAVSDDSGCRKDSEKLPFPQGYRDLRYNPDKSVLGIVTGIGTARATASIKALGMDPRFDLSKAYWLVAGIAGVNPNEASIGSATWAEWVIDSDLGFEVDAREIPASCTRSAREF
jgi:purine nucleoside permease